MKFCKDCRHCIPNPNTPDDPEMALCGLRSKTSIVTGVTTRTHCEIERKFGECGMEGWCFEAAVAVAP